MGRYFRALAFLSSREIFDVNFFSVQSTWLFDDRVELSICAYAEDKLPAVLKNAETANANRIFFILITRLIFGSFNRMF